MTILKGAKLVMRKCRHQVKFENSQSTSTHLMSNCVYSVRTFSYMKNSLLTLIGFLKKKPLTRMKYQQQG